MKSVRQRNATLHCNVRDFLSSFIKMLNAVLFGIIIMDKMTDLSEFNCKRCVFHVSVSDLFRITALFVLDVNELIDLISF